MSPKDGWTSTPEQTWVLAGGEHDPVLIYSPSGDEITLNQPLPASTYSAIWFDPETGEARAPEPASGAAHTIFKKPSTHNWLLLLRRDSQ
jgi:hypothetical protein